MEKIKAAVIGCGRMGAFTSDLMKEVGPKCWFPLSHIEGLNHHEEIFLEAICDSNESLLKKAGDLYDVKYRYSDSQELFDKHKIDLLTVATRTRDRFQIIKDGIASGVKAFHLEKPLCNSMQELNEIESLVSENKICLTYGTLRRYFEIYQKAKDLVDSGVYGKLVQVQVNFGQKPLFWAHPHCVDTILFFSGKRKLKYVQSHLSNVIFAGDNILESDPLVEQSNMIFDDGLMGSITKNPGSDVFLNCEKGVVIVESNGSQISVRAATQDSPYFEHSKKSLPTIVLTLKELIVQ